MPNDVPLTNSSRQVLSTAHKKTWLIVEPACSGGGFAFVRGGNIPGTKIHGEFYLLPFDFESGKGLSGGALFEVGIGHTPIAVGGEVAVNWKTREKSGAVLGFANKDIGGLKAGGASIGLLGDTHGNFGGYASLGAIGVGIYAKPSFVNGCLRH